ncbi:MAG: hypothetical protein ACH34X_11045 [Thiolinea sp.]
MLKLVGCLAIALQLFSATGVQASSCVITSNSIAGVKVGIKVSDIKKVLPKAKLKRSSDGEGLALISVLVNGKELMQAYANEENPEAKINLTKKVVSLETLNPLCKTKDNIGPRVFTSVAAKKWGGVKEIMKSEIESREYITFKRQPKGLELRIDYSGIYKAGVNTTTRYKKNSKIYSLSIGG